MKKGLRRLTGIVLSAIVFLTSVSWDSFTVSAASKDYVTDLFGSNVYVFDENDSQSEIQAVIDEVYGIQETNQFGEERYAVLFKPGTYDDVRVKVGYYTQVAGLGDLPTDTVVNEFDCNADWMQGNSTCNFWRSAENFTVKQTATWAAAQATSLRRMKFEQWLALDQWGQGWASGGFVADTVVEGAAVAWSQQQYCSRNNNYGAWAGGVWNAVFIGMNSDLTVQDAGNKVENNWETNPGYQYFTCIEKTPVIRETPYLTVDENDNFSVFVPQVRKDTNEVSWVNGKEEGKEISIDKFYIAKPEKDTADTINAALNSGKHLIFTPGIYRLDKTIQVTKENTVVLGLGYATLIPVGNHPCMEVADKDGISVSGLLFDAGKEYTETLLKVGEDNASKRHATNPILLSDLFFRVGGTTSDVTQSKTCIIINSKDVIGDNFWVWRADHGDGVAWDKNKTENGIVINGDCMTMYGLFVEHFHEYQTVWNGDYGRLYFYQSEIPYDIPNQESWMSHDNTVKGFASYKVADDVTSHEAYGLGIYSYHRDATVDLENAAEVPDAENVSVHNICTVMLAGNPGITHVINGMGDAVTIAGERQQVVSYGSGKVVIPEVTEEPEERVNVALGKSGAASTVQGWNTAGNAFDGNADSRWESEFTDNQWILVDLEKNYSVDGVKLVWETAAGKEYKIEVSTDGTNWKSVHHKTDGAGGTEEISFAAEQARYVRMNGITRTTGYGFSLWEFEVYGKESVEGGEVIPPQVATGPYAEWKNKAITFPEMGQLVPAGPITVQWNSFGDEAKSYEVYLDNEKIADIEESGLASYECEIYTTKVSAHQVKVAAVLESSGKRVTANIRNFFVSKKGMGIWQDRKDMIEKTNLSWYYNWSPFELDGVSDKVEFVPMIWGNDDGSSSRIAEWEWLNNGGYKDYDTLLTFNEPDYPDQSNMSYERAAQLWPRLEETGLRLTSPATGNPAYFMLGGEGDWFGPFMNQLASQGDEFDVTAVHYYQDYPLVDLFVETLENTYKMTGKPIWITEWGVGQWTQVQDFYWTGGEDNWQRALIVDFMEQIIPILDELDYVERYAWFPFDGANTENFGNGAGGLFYNTGEKAGQLTSVGLTYQALGNPSGYDANVVVGDIVVDDGDLGEETSGGSGGNPSIDVPPSYADFINLAIGKTAQASTSLGGNQPQNAIDQSKDSRWESEFADNQWIRIDLGDTYTIGGVNLIWETAAGKDYTIDISEDGQNWTTVYTKADGKGGNEEIRFDTVNARYVRMNGKTRTTGYGFSLWEMEVLGLEKADVPEGEGQKPENSNTTNYALNAVVTTSSNEGAFTGDSAVDGNEATRWASAFRDEEWICIDLGEIKEISEAVLMWEAAYGKVYEIQVSENGTDFTTAVKQQNGKGNTEEITFSTTKARYVRIQGIERGTGYGYSLWEVQIY